MPYFNLFKVPLDKTKAQMQEEFSHVCKLKSINLMPNERDRKFQFASINYEKVSDEKGMYELIQGVYRVSPAFKLPHTHNTKRSSQDQRSGRKPNNRNDSKGNNEAIENPSFNYYKDRDYGRNITKFTLPDVKEIEPYFKIEGAHSFDLTTVYPGLLIGSGYNHPKVKGNNDDFQLGFYFDHTTGLPAIPGSSVKGVLRFVVSNMDNEGLPESETVETLFEDGSIIYHDAYLVATDNECGRIFGDDSITSHHSDDPMGAFKEPNPVKFLKILSEVTFRFQFDIKNRDEEQAKRIVDLFEGILLDFGVGAKTNVGYGQFRK